MGLLDAIDGPRPLRSAFYRGWLTGLGYFALSTWWIAEAFMVDAANQGWMAPFAVAAMAAGLALFWGLAAMLLSPGPPARRAAAAGVRRRLRGPGMDAGHILTGFPWNLPGETWRAGSAVSQAAALVGAYGLTWITLAVAAAPAVWRDGKRGADRRGIGGRRPGRRSSSAAPARSVRPPPSGSERAQRPHRPGRHPAGIKWDAAGFAQIVQAYVSLTAKPYAGQPADIVVWPEGACRWPSTTTWSPAAGCGRRSSTPCGRAS